jgi:hypothetical protein
MMIGHSAERGARYGPSNPKPAPEGAGSTKTLSATGAGSDLDNLSISHCWR